MDLTIELESLPTDRLTIPLFLKRKFRTLFTGVLNAVAIEGKNLLWLRRFSGISSYESVGHHHERKRVMMILAWLAAMGEGVAVVPGVMNPQNKKAWKPLCDWITKCSI
ncbi:hypothetical protein [Marininema halotolerans]|uniref:Uncharacterized protein n=1 Tax=Marininema halotolerans TaxID=1155944 RepID=A0A1I6SV03_9BACL|nr:hypothetical protein [Marininema halotolerans]SFS80759.1 hypothetical protein SAMN05444972_10858 [Marininema halotolerans]